MAQVQANNVTYAYIVKDFARQATTLKDPSSATYIKEGEVVVAGLDNHLLTSTGTTYENLKEVKISQLKEEGLVSSPAIVADNVTFYKVTGYAASQEKIMYIGYNGTSGSLENNVFIPGTDYEVNVRRLGLLQHTEDSYITHKMFSYFNSSATSGEAIVAKGLVKNGVDNFDNDVDGFVMIEMITACTNTAATSTVGFIRGSKVAVATGAHGITACDYIQDTYGAVYYVESVDGNNIYLEVPYQRDSCTVTPRIITDVTSDHWGIRITGKEKKFSTDGKYRYDIADFDVTLKYFVNTTTSTYQSASLGNGTWKEVAQLEWEVQDYEGQTSHTDHLMPTRATYFEKDKEYDVLIIRSYDNSVDQISGTPKSPFTLFIAIPIGNTQGDSAGTSTVASGVAEALDNWLTANTSTTYTEVDNLT